jgi:hypothetical protein
MLQYGLAEDTSRSGGADNSPSDLYSQSAIYVAAAHALKPNYSVCGFLYLPLCCLPIWFVGSFWMLDMASFLSNSVNSCKRQNMTYL